MVEEHRLALVLNGGISLSIWMGGVANELDVVRRASSAGADLPAMTDAEREVFRLWQRACAGKPRVVVDVIAGTSAGGVNGVFLAAAIARNGTLGSLKALWMDRAQLDGQDDHLLDPRRPTVNSVLNGASFLDGVVDGLAAITPIADKAGEDVSLITTASAVGGPSRAFRDSQGTPFRLPDHRRRYRFRSGAGAFIQEPGGAPLALERGSDVDDFGPDAADALARAARATASIPGVFDPVHETQVLRDHRQLPDCEDGSPLDWLMDGGLLDNAPFDAVLDAIGKRPVDATWQRTLGYIVPSAPDPQVEQVEASGMPSWTAIVPKIFTYPGESNLRDGIDRLASMMDASQADIDVQRFVRLVSGEGPATIAAGAEAVFPFYQSAAARAGIAEAYDAASGDGVQTLQPDPSLDVTSIVGSPQTWLPSAAAFALGDDWCWGVAAADRVARLFLRSISGMEGAAQNGRRAALHEITEKLHAIRKIVRAELGSKPFDPLSADNIAVAISHVYDELGVSQRLGDLMHDAAGLVAAAHAVDPDVAMHMGLTLLVLHGVSGLPVKYTPTPIFDFRRFDVRLPLDLFGLAALQAQGRIANPSDILYGTRLGHFAAFGKREWREWDWLWGRISATMHLCELLDVPDQAADIIRAIVKAEDTSEDLVATKANALLTSDGTTSAQLFTQLRTAGGTVLPAAEAALRMGDRWSVAPSLPGLAGSVGAMLATIVGRERPTPSNAVQPPPPAPALLARLIGSIGRGIVAPPRWLLWRWLGR